MVRSSVGVLNPIQFAFAHDSVRIGIEFQERCDLRHPFLHVPPNLNAALGVERRSEQDVDVALRPGEQEPLAEAVERDAALSRVAAVNVAIALGVIEFLDAGRNDLGAWHSLAKINGRLGDVQAKRAFGRNVFDEELRKSAERALRDKTHHDAIAVGEFQVLIHPRLCLSGKLGRQLAGRKHHLVIAVCQMVAIDIDRVEMVIKTYGLRLLVSLHQGTRIPKANVANGASIAGNGCGGQVLQRRVGDFLDDIQVVSIASEFNVVRQIRRLPT